MWSVPFSSTLAACLSRASRWLVAAILLATSGLSGAAIFHLPADFGSGVFSSCSLSAGVYHCTQSIDLGNDNNADIYVTSNLTLTIDGSFTAKNNLNIYNAGGLLTLSVTGNVDIKNNLDVTANISAPNGSIIAGNNGTVVGNLSASTITAGSLVVTGNLTAQSASGSITVNGTCIVGSGGCPGAPTVTTTAASSVTGSSATLNGTVSGATSVSFDYGTSTSYDHTVSATQSGTTSSWFANIQGLNCATTYHFRARGSNSSGTTTLGSDLSFTAAACSAARFSAYETAISNTAAATATATARYIKTRVSGSSGSLCQADGSTCSLRVAAFLASGAIDTSFNGTASASLDYCTNVSRIGTSVSCGGSWTQLAAPQTVTLANGVGTVTFPYVNNVYEVVRVNITSSMVSGGPWYSDDYFAIRPASLLVSASDATSSTAGSTRSLTSGANVHQAMQPFTLNAQALVATATAASNYPPSSYSGAGPVSKTVVSSAGVNGTLTPGTWSSAGSGTATSSSATYSEVGSFTLTLEDQSYADVDRADGQSSSSDRYFSGSASLGRFIPAYFATTITPAMTVTSDPTCPVAANGMVYSGQTFSVTVSAKNASGGTTANYDSAAGLAKATTLSAVTSVGGTTAPGGVLAATAVAATTFASGVSTLSTEQYTFATTPTSPADIYLRATESTGGDGVSSLRTPAAASVEGGVKVVNGRLFIENMYGPPHARLTLKAKALYWDGSQWRLNTADTSSGNAVANFVRSVGGTCSSTSSPSWCGISLISATSTATGGTTCSGGIFSLILSPSSSTASSSSLYLSSALSYLPGKGRLNFGMVRAPYVYQRER